VVTPAGNDALTELARRKIIGIDDRQYDDSFLESKRPYVWTWAANASLRRKRMAEYVCARLVNRPATWAGAPYTDRPRKIGAIYENVEGIRDAGDEIKRFVKAQCGVDVDPVVPMWNDDSAQLGPTLATAVAKLQSAGVTSVIMPTWTVGTIAITGEASKSGYFPEWVIVGDGGTDENATGRLIDPTEWNGHAFGISGKEIEGDLQSYRDGVRVYKELDPGGSPDAGPLGMFPQLQQLANGIQMAGPNLTPETFERGLFAMALRQGPPNWARSGGFRPGNHGFENGVGEIWWDASATDSEGNRGAYRWTRGGQRWTLGHIPPGETTVFQDGVATRPDDWGNY
jgi:hypothetical protein